MSDGMSSSVRQELLKQHVALEATLKNLSNSATSPDPRPLQAAWSEFESRLLAHLELEEGTIIPLFAASHADEAHELLAEHDRIRDVVFELGLCCDLHALRTNAVSRLIGLLRSHAEHEDATLYRWLDEHAPLDTRRHLLRLLVSTIRSELHAKPAEDRPPAT